MKKNIIILSGDPNSINSELIFKSFIKLSNENKKKFISSQALIYLNLS